MIDFISLGYTTDEQEMLQDAYQAIEKANMWDYMKGEPRGGGGYTFTDDEELVVRANGYCAGCWTERYGCEDISPISYASSKDDDQVDAAIQIQNWWRKVSTRWYKEPKCDGCYFNVLNQLGHMGIGGCLYEPDPYEFE